MNKKVLLLSLLSIIRVQAIPELPGIEDHPEVKRLTQQQDRATASIDHQYDDLRRSNEERREEAHSLMTQNDGKRIEHEGVNFRSHDEINEHFDRGNEIINLNHIADRQASENDHNRKIEAKKEELTKRYEALKATDLLSDEFSASDMANLESVINVRELQQLVPDAARLAGSTKPLTRSEQARLSHATAETAERLYKALDNNPSLRAKFKNKTFIDELEKKYKNLSKEKQASIKRGMNQNEFIEQRFRNGLKIKLGITAAALALIVGGIIAAVVAK